MFTVLGFLGSGPGKIAMIVLAFAIWTGVVANHASEAAWVKAEVACREEVQARTAIEVERQNEATNAALVRALGRATQMEAERNELESRVDTILERIRATPSGAGCHITDAFRRELHSIR